MLNLGNVKLHNIKIKYVSSKTDKYNNEFSYYIIENENFLSKINDNGIASPKGDDIIKNGNGDITFPWFVGKDYNNYLIKIKKRYLKEEEKISGEATINLKKYDYKDREGYYIDKIEFKQN